MTILDIAQFLDDHPQWSPSFGQRIKSKVYYVDGFYNSTGRYVSLETVQLLIATCWKKQTAPDDYIEDGA